MNFLNSWLQGIIVAVMIATIIQMIMPEGNNKKYIKTVLGVFLLFNIITPIANQFFTNSFELSSVIDTDKYIEKIEAYEVDSSNINIDKANEKNIMEIYISNLKNDIKAKLTEKNYEVNKIDVEIVNKDNYEVNSLSINLNKRKEQVDKEEKQNKVTINEIEKVEIQISKQKQEEQEKQSNNLTEKEKKEVKQYLSSTYEIKQDNIDIY